MKQYRIIEALRTERALNGEKICKMKAGRKQEKGKAEIEKGVPSTLRFAKNECGKVETRDAGQDKMERSNIGNQKKHKIMTRTDEDKRNVV